MEILIMLFMLAFNPGGDIIAAPADGGGIALWSVEESEMIGEIPGEMGTVLAMQYSPDGKLLMAGDDSGNIIFIDAEKNEIIESIPEHEGDVFSVAFTPDGSLAVSAGRDGFVNVWNVQDKMIYKKLKAHSGKVFSLSFSNDGKWLATCGDDGNLKFWKLPTLELKQTISAANVLAIDFSPTDLTLVASSDSPNLKKFMLVDGEWKRTGSVPTTDGFIASIAFTPDGKGILTGSDYSVFYTDLDTGIVETVLEDENGIWGLMVSPDGGMLGYLNPDMTPKLHALDTDGEGHPEK